MATSGELVRTVAGALDISDVTVGVYYRKLREAGLVTKGGRGRSAPSLTYLDGARLLVSLMASDTGVSAAQATETFGRLPLTKIIAGDADYPGFSLSHFRKLKFEQAITCLMEVVAASDHERLITDDMYPLVVTVRTDEMAEIRFADIDARYDNFPSDWVGAETGFRGSPSRISHSEQMPVGLLVQRSIGGRALAQIATSIGASEAEHDFSSGA